MGLRGACIGGARKAIKNKAVIRVDRSGRMPKLDFLGKGDVYTHHLTVPYHTLEADKKKSVGKADIDGNLIIHGDNLYALKALLPRYESKIKCIYIDPPYNTGNDWQYNDKVNSPLIKTWLNKTVDRDDQTRHDKWLSMMWPRLQLLHELLAEDGVIFISIDDNEQHHLRAIIDEIFGEENFVANIIWQKKYSPQNDARHFSDNHDFILCYAKDKETWRPILLPRTEQQDERYKNPDNDPRGRWKSSGLDAKSYSAGGLYPITTPSGRVVHPPPGRHWAYTEERFHELVKDNRIWFGEKGNNVPSVKLFLSEVKQGLTPLTIWLYQEVGHNQIATQELKKIDISDFPSPKPSTLLKRIFHIGADKDSIILDSFAGSGTTAQAVLELNKEDGGNRKFILVECEDEIADKITAERVRRVIKGVPKAKSETLKAGLGGNFTFYTLGQEIDPEKILTGESLPDYETLAAHVFWLATGQTLPSKATQRKDWFIGETATMRLYLIYKPDIEFLGSKESALNFEMGEAIQKQLKPKQKAYVFAPAAYVSHKDLRALRLAFCQLPWSLQERLAGLS